MAPQESTTATDHDVIRAWAEDRGGRPARVRDSETEGGDPQEGGVLRIAFEDDTDDLEDISWDEFFEIFDSRTRAFLYQEETADGGISRFCKFVSRDGEA